MENQERDSEDYDGVKHATHLNLLGDLSASGCGMAKGVQRLSCWTRQKIPGLSGNTREVLMPTFTKRLRGT